MRQAGYDVILTRQDDSTVSLSERINKAHTHKVDLFISIHANAGAKGAQGIETFYADNLERTGHTHVMSGKAKKAAIKLAAHVTQVSREFAQDVQTAVVGEAKKVYTKVVDRGIKSGSCQVLMGFQGPAVLIEVGYLTAAHEGALLQTSDYQKQIAKGISKGIKMFIEEHFA